MFFFFSFSVLHRYYIGIVLTLMMFLYSFITFKCHIHIFPDYDHDDYHDKQICKEYPKIKHVLLMVPLISWLKSLIKIKLKKDNSCSSAFTLPKRSS